MQTAPPLVRDLVLVGGGHSHALVLRKWGMDPLPGVRLTVIDLGPATAYSGMLPGFVAGHYRRTDLDIDLVRLARFAGARLLLGGATGLDPEARRIEVSGHGPVFYDIASVDIGITARMPALPGFAHNAVPAKPLAGFADRWDAFVAAVARGDSEPRVALIGGGVAGVELALTMHHRLTGTCGRAEITLIDRTRLLSDMQPRARRRLLKRLDAAGVTVRENTEIREITPAGPVLQDGTLLPAALTVGAAGATPASWLADTGLTLRDGFIAVDAHLRSLSHAEVFAAGDCAHMTAAPRPKAGVFAVRAAPVLFDNLRAALADRPTRPFRPQRRYLKLVSLGPKAALAQKGRVVLGGAAMWRWKDHIDRSFMAKLQDLPAMTPAALPRHAPRDDDTPAETMLCGGCGAKVGPEPLTRALAALPTATASGLENRLGDDAAILRMGDGWQVVSTDHLRAVVEDPETMTRIALYHAMGDVWAMGAHPQIALAQVILPRMSPRLQERTVAEITAAAHAAASELGAALAGGHTTMGSELTLGFTVTGLSPRAPVGKAGAEPGDALILTRGLGSGTLLAAEMRMQARGAWIADLLALMTTPQHPAAELLGTKAHAMTDVTGFGLAGHALEMSRASGAGLTLRLRDIPFLAGAAELAATGIRSTIAPANRAACLPALTGLPDTAEGALLFDPQTCGGLLAAIGPGDAAGLCDAIRATGQTARIIGTVTDAPPGLTLL